MLSKTLQKAIKNKPIDLGQSYTDSDGHWLMCEPGWRGPYAHCIHGDTVQDALWQLKEIEACNCHDCERAMIANP